MDNLEAEDSMDKFVAMSLLTDQNFNSILSNFQDIEAFRVYKYLKFVSKNDNIIEELKRNLTCWDYKSTASLTDFKEDIEQVVREIGELVFSSNNDNKIYKFIWGFVHYEIYDHVSSLTKEKFAKDDLNLYKTSRKFCKNNGSPKQLGATFYNFIPNAAVVELSMLNNKRTPMDKLTCLHSAYDYIFAEIKGALISVISKYSVKEIDLPSINNKEVIPIVMAVILKSKLFYFISDMYYIAQFGTNILNQEEQLSEIYQIFEQALNKIVCTQSEYPPRSSEKLDNKLSVCDTINFVEELAKEKTNNQTLFEEERKRVAKLITTSTTEELERSLLK